MIKFSRVTHGQEEKDAVCRVLDSEWWAAGAEVEAFEQEFSDYISPKGEHYYCIFTPSCTSALKLAYKLAKTQGYTTFIVPKNTYTATYAAAVEVGCKYIFDDEVEEGSPEYQRTVVHFGSVKDETPCLIEDSAHRIEPKDPLVGKIRCYSFHATKNMSTGHGGMFVTNDKDIYEKARLYWRDGIDKSLKDRHTGSWDYTVREMAVGYDGCDINASIGREQLKKLAGFTRRRNQLRDQYNLSLSQDWQGNHIYPYFVSSIEQVGSLIDFLKENEIQASHHYPNSGWLGVSIPLYPLLSDDESACIIDSIKDWESKYGKNKL